MNHTIFDIAFEHAPGVCRRACGPGGGLARRLGRRFAHASVHGFIGEAIGFLIPCPQGVADFEAIETGGAAAGFLPKRAERWAGDFVGAFHLLDHQFRVGNDAQTAGAVFSSPGKDGEQPLVLGVVVGLAAQVFAEAGDDAALRIFNDGAESGGSGIAARAAIAVGGEPGGGLGCGWSGFGKKG